MEGEKTTFDYKEIFAWYTQNYSKEDYGTLLNHIKKSSDVLKKNMRKGHSPLTLETLDLGYVVTFFNTGDIDHAINSLTEVIDDYDQIRKVAIDKFERRCAENNLFYKVKIGVKDILKKYLKVA